VRGRIGWETHAGPGRKQRVIVKLLPMKIKPASELRLSPLTRPSKDKSGRKDSACTRKDSLSGPRRHSDIGEDPVNMIMDRQPSSPLFHTAVFVHVTPFLDSPMKLYTSY
jgi:hypothetical protein